MKKLNSDQIYKNLYYGNINKIDKNLSIFIKQKEILSKQNKTDPNEFEY